MSTEQNEVPTCDHGYAHPCVICDGFDAVFPSRFTPSGALKQDRAQAQSQRIRGLRRHVRHLDAVVKLRNAKIAELDAECTRMQYVAYRPHWFLVSLIFGVGVILGSILQ